MGMSEIDELLRRNEAYAASFDQGHLPAAPSRRLAIVTCMDARIDVHRILGLREGEAHILRNAGGVVTEDVIRSLTISQRLLGTREIMLIHHTDCGILTFRDDDLKDRIQAEIGIRPPFALEAFSDLEEDVRQSIRRLQASPFLPHKDAIRGFVYDVRTGRLREVPMNP
jgi:carbonic anhydrase